jgi:cytoplasmic iron level regulating protein YaaA (DUF328/UPF0246 family)
MMIVLSPAKTLDFESPLPEVNATEADFVSEADQLIRRLKRCKADEIAALMELSPALAELNHARYRQWARSHDPQSSRPCVLAFAGDVYEGLRAGELNPEDLSWAQHHLRILSGLYGLLRPLDRIQPYRLEMGTRLDTRRGRDLYGFWGERLARRLRADLDAHAQPTLVNLASVEYFKALPVRALARPVIQPVFQEQRGDGYKIISFMAKRARGLMARYAITHRIDRPEGLLDFDAEGYRFDPSASNESTWTFRRSA